MFVEFLMCLSSDTSTCKLICQSSNSADVKQIFWYLERSLWARSIRAWNTADAYFDHFALFNFLTRC